MPTVLNLGSGAKTSAHPDVVNIDWSIYLRISRSPILRRIAPLVLDAPRRDRLASLPSNVLVHDLRKGIPFPSGAVDIVYHSHLMEHLDRTIASSFTREVHRVLRPGGIHRIVVPDLELRCRAYLDHAVRCAASIEEWAAHDDYVAAIIEQSVRREAAGTRQRRGVRRAVENILLGDARRRGETHQWMYDRFNLGRLLKTNGFGEISVQRFDRSNVENWGAYGLDIEPDGTEYKPGSLYLEAVRQ